MKYLILILPLFTSCTFTMDPKIVEAQKKEEEYKKNHPIIITYKIKEPYEYGDFTTKHDTNYWLIANNGKEYWVDYTEFYSKNVGDTIKEE